MGASSPALDSPLQDGPAQRISTLDAHERFLETRSFGSLDGLRAVSILVVIWHHTHDGVAGWPITFRGFLGVDLFFVISGFLIVSLLLREIRRNGSTSLRKFYVRRFLRIFPPYYTMLLIVDVVSVLKPGQGSVAVRHDLQYALLYVSNLVPMASMLAITWSLSVEEQFYLLIPTAQKVLGRTLPSVLIGTYVLVSAPMFGIPRGLELPDFFRQTTFGPIILGVLLAYALDDPRIFHGISRILGHRLAPMFTAALVLIICNQSPADVSHGLPRITMHWALLLLVGSCVVRERHVLQPLLTAWPMRRIGSVSYGIYLYHLLVMHFVVKAMNLMTIEAQFLLFVLTALATWLVAELSYRFFESRFLALKERWAA